MSFYSLKDRPCTNYENLLLDKRVSSVRHERGKRLWFDVSDIPVGETIVDAELRLYQNSNYSADLSENFTVTVYQLLLEDG